MCRQGGEEQNHHLENRPGEWKELERSSGPGFPAGFSAMMERLMVCMKTAAASAVEHLKGEGPNFSFHLVLIHLNLNSRMGWLFWQRTNRRSKGRRWEKNKTQVGKTKDHCLMRQ